MSHARSEYDDFKTLAPDAYDAAFTLGRAAAKAGIDRATVEMIKLRASEAACDEAEGRMKTQ